MPEQRLDSREKRKGKRKGKKGQREGAREGICVKGSSLVQLLTCRVEGERCNEWGLCRKDTNKVPQRPPILDMTRPFYPHMFGGTRWCTRASSSLAIMPTLGPVVVPWQQEEESTLLDRGGEFISFRNRSLPTRSFSPPRSSLVGCDVVQYLTWPVRFTTLTCWGNLVHTNISFFAHIRTGHCSLTILGGGIPLGKGEVHLLLELNAASKEFPSSS